MLNCQLFCFRSLSENLLTITIDFFLKKKMAMRCFSELDRILVLWEQKMSLTCESDEQRLCRVLRRPLLLVSKVSCYSLLRQVKVCCISRRKVYFVYFWTMYKFSQSFQLCFFLISIPSLQTKNLHSMPHYGAHSFLFYFPLHLKSQAVSLYRHLAILSWACCWEQLVHLFQPLALEDNRSG